jgi:alkylation response protein AidB-like acyl-CoA dehydrogenase
MTTSVTGLGAATVLDRVAQLAEELARDHTRRQGARQLSHDDFDAVAETGFHKLVVPTALGGAWTSTASSTRVLAGALAMLAAGDSSLALILSMEPVALLIAGWLTDIPIDQTDPGWREQRDHFLTLLAAEDTAWGVLLAERGNKIRATATRRVDGTWSINGEKLAGSGWDYTSFMLTSAVPDGEDQPEAFVLDLRDRDSLSGAEISRAWDGHGMTASGSHSIRLTGMGAERIAWPGRDAFITGAMSTPMPAARLAPFVGIVRAAMASTKQQLEARGGIRGSLEAVEWARAQADGWLLDQAFEGVLRATETSCSSAEFDLETKLAKMAACELAESALRHASGAIGGSSYSAFSPIGWWHEDVRALGLLRPTLSTLVDDVGSRGGQ